jgi:hypothetical protein
MKLLARAFKGDQLRFEESRLFRLREASQGGVSSDRILLGDAVKDSRQSASDRNLRRTENPRQP